MLNYLEAVLTLGLIFSLLSLGILISFRIFAFADITTEGSLALGAAVATLLLLHGAAPWAAAAVGLVCGSLGGVLTAVLYTRLSINGLLAGLLVVPTLYSVVYRLTDEAPIDLPAGCTLAEQAAALASRMGLPGLPPNLVMLGVMSALVLLVLAALAWFFHTGLGVAMRATGDNTAMVRGYGIDVGMTTIFGLALANALAGLAGSLLVLYHGRFQLQVGVGMIVWGLASVLIGENLFPGKQVVRMLLRTVLGALLFRFILEGVLQAGMHPSDLKFISALFVLLALLWPRLTIYLAKRRAQEKEERAHAGA